jgi:hypothetical protein
MSALKEWSSLQKIVSKVLPKKFYEIDPWDLSYLFVAVNVAVLL